MGLSPIQYCDLVALHNNCVKALALSKGKAKEPAKNADVDTGIYGIYVRLHVPFKSRIEYLNKVLDRTRLACALDKHPSS